MPRIKRKSLPVITKAECKGCGACCRHVGHPMFVRAGFFDSEPAGEEAWQNLPEDLKREVSDYLDALDGDDLGESCIWLEPDGTCRHYEHRPRVCREFEVGGESCLSVREEQKRRRGIV